LESGIYECGWKRQRERVKREDEGRERKGDEGGISEVNDRREEGKSV